MLLSNLLSYLAFMHLKIASPEHPIYTGDIRQITIPTEMGEITILPGHQPLTGVVKAGLLAITPEQLPHDQTNYTIENGQIILSVAKGLVLVDGTNIVITTSAASAHPQHSAEILEQMRKDMQEQLDKIRVEGNMDDFEKAMINFEKITADLRLAKLKNIK